MVCPRCQHSIVLVKTALSGVKKWEHVIRTTDCDCDCDEAVVEMYQRRFAKPAKGPINALAKSTITLNPFLMLADIFEELKEEEGKKQPDDLSTARYPRFPKGSDPPRGPEP